LYLCTPRASFCFPQLGRLAERWRMPKVRLDNSTPPVVVPLRWNRRGWMDLACGYHILQLQYRAFHLGPGLVSQ